MSGGATGTAMEDEFDTEAGWTSEAVHALGHDHAIPAACRGTASPAALDWLGDTSSLHPGARLLDVGAGIGGPAARAVERYGVRPLLVDPMPTACRAAEDLFGLPAMVASGQALPLADAAVDVVWCLGVLCTTRDKPALLAEARRVLSDDGSLGLFVLLGDDPQPPGAPEGNVFPSRPELTTLLTAAGFRVSDERAIRDLPSAPSSWTERIAAVDEFIEHRHGDDPRHRSARDQERRMARLMEDRTVTGVVLHAEAVGHPR